MKKPFFLALIVILISGAIAYANVPNASVTTDKIAYRAVTTSKIANDSIKAAKIADNAVRTSEIGNGVITLGSAADGTIAGKLNAKYQVVTSTGLADTEFTVTHQLGRTPVGFLLVKSNKATSVYDSGTAWTDTSIFLKSSAATAEITLIIF